MNEDKEKFYKLNLFQQLVLYGIYAILVILMENFKHTPSVVERAKTELIGCAILGVVYDYCGKKILNGQ